MAVQIAPGLQDAQEALVPAQTVKAVPAQLEHAGGQLASHVRPLFPAVAHRLVQIQPADRVIVGGARGILKAQAAAGLCAFDDVVQGVGLVEQITLDLVAAELLHEIEMLDGLHALDEGVDAELLGHLDDLGDDDVVLAAGAEIAHELHVQLDEVEIHFLQKIERGILAAEIVQPDLKALLMEALHLAADHLLVRDEGGFRDLDLQKAVGKLRRVQARADLLHHITALEVPAGEVYRHRHHRHAQLHPLPAVAQDLVDHVQIQFIHQPALLQHGDEAGGH